MRSEEFVIVFQKHLKIRMVAVCVLSLFLVSCAAKNRSSGQIDQDIAQQEDILRNNALLDELQGLAQTDYLAYTEALQTKPLGALLAPINARLNIFQARLEKRRMAGKGEDSVVFAAIACYHPEAVIVWNSGNCQARRLKNKRAFDAAVAALNVNAPTFAADMENLITQYAGRDITRDIQTTVAAVPAQIQSTGAVTMFLQEENMQPLLTYDPSQDELLKTVYMFGDERFDLLYVTIVTMRVKALADSVSSNPMAMFSNAQEIAEGTMFATNLLQLLGQASQAGGEIVGKVIGAVSQ